MKAAVKQLKDKSVKTKQGMFAALQELVAVAPESLGAFVPQVMPGIQAALQVHSTAHLACLDCGLGMHNLYSPDTRTL